MTFGRWDTFRKPCGHGRGQRGSGSKHLGHDTEMLRVEQMVILKTSAVNGSAGAYCFGHNVGLSKEIGITDEEIEAIRDDYKSSNLLTEREKAAIRWAEAITKLEAENDDSAFEDLKQHFDDNEIVELTVLSCMWNFSNRFCGALHIELEPPEEQITFRGPD